MSNTIQQLRVTQAFCSLQIALLESELDDEATENLTMELRCVEQKFALACIQQRANSVNTKEPT